MLDTPLTIYVLGKLLETHTLGPSRRTKWGKFSSALYASRKYYVYLSYKFIRPPLRSVTKSFTPHIYRTKLKSMPLSFCCCTVLGDDDAPGTLCLPMLLIYAFSFEFSVRKLYRTQQHSHTHRSQIPPRPPHTHTRTHSHCCYSHIQ